MTGKRRTCLYAYPLCTATVWISVVLAGSPVRIGTTSGAFVAAATTSLSAAPAVIPPSPGKVDWRRRYNARNNKAFRSSGSNKCENPSMPHPHNTCTPAKRLRDIVKRRLRHSLCASSPPFVAQKAGFDGDEFYRNSVQRNRHRPGTRFTTRFPDIDMADEMWKHMRVGDEMPYNHDSVGMTRPSDLVPTSLATSHGKGIGEGPAMRDYSLDKYCWPDSEISDECARRKGRWRVLRYRKYVGHGEECYKRVRRAVLNWEFATVCQEGSSKENQGMRKDENFGESKRKKRKKAMGIIRARDVLSQDQEGKEVLGSAQEMVLGPGGRRMVTYTECRYGIDIKPNLRLGLPIFYAVNPVASVYDIVDKRCPNGDTFTTTAYATVGDHLLSGEERVSVVMRRTGSVHIEILSRSRPAPTFAGRLVWPFIGRMQNVFFAAEMDHLLGAGRDVI